MGIPKGGIAFFDSGIGGLNVLHACAKYIEEGTFYYYGDNRHAPYGNLPIERMDKYVFKIFKKFKRLKVCAAVIACNTVTAVCIEKLRRRFDFPIIGTEPAVLDGARTGKRVLVLSTRATFESERFHRLCEKARRSYPNSEIIALPCDNLAGAIEKNLYNEGFDYNPLLPNVHFERGDSSHGKDGEEEGESSHPDVVVLGCTHYLYIEEWVKKKYNCAVCDGNEGVAKQLLRVLEKKNRKNRDGKPLFQKNDKKQGFIFTFFRFFRGKKDIFKNANKSLQQEARNPLKTKGKGEIYFLGKSAKINQNTYKKHTFAR